jgi:hypothetical protein
MSPTRRFSGHTRSSRTLAGRLMCCAMVANGTRLIVIGKDQVYTDMPEYRVIPTPHIRTSRVRHGRIRRHQLR